MAAPVPLLMSNGNGITSPDRSDEHRMLDGEQLRELSSPRGSVKSPDGSWDAGSFDSPRSSRSTSSIESPFPSSSNMMTKSLSGKLKPKRNQSSYFDEETGTWKCRNCGGTYDVPNPGSRQRREHKKACEETQRLQAIKRAEEEQARREEAAREAALRDQGVAEASNRQDGESYAGKVRDDSSIMGAFDTTPDIPEREEVNFEAPKELIHNIERDSTVHLRETQTAEAQGSEINGQERSHGQDGAELDRTEWNTSAAFREGVPPPPRQFLPAADEDFGGKANSSLKTERSGELKAININSKDQGLGGKSSSPLKSERSGELKSVNSNGTPNPNKIQANVSLDHHWIDKGSSTPETRTSQEFEQVKYCSSAPSNEIHLAGTLYDRLMDLHDDPQVVLTRSASLEPGRHGIARIASSNHEMGIAEEANFNRSLSLDHYGVSVTARRDYNSNRAAAKLERGTEPTTGMELSRDATPDELIEALIGRDPSKAPSTNPRVEMHQNHSNFFGNGIVGDGRYGHFPTAVPSVVSRRIQPDSPRATFSSREESGSPQAAGTSSKQPQPHNPRESAGNGKNRSDSPEEDDNLIAMIARNVGKFGMQYAAVGAVAVIAWVGKSLANRQREPRCRPPNCRRTHCALDRYYWDE